jgi:hypothetical protein
MPVLLIIGVLLLLWAFIVWERRRPVQPLPRASMARGWSARALLKWPSFAGLALCCGVLGTVEWLQPSQPPFTGKLSLFFRAAYEQLGPVGVAYVWWAVAALLALAAFASWRAKAVLGSNENAER